MPNSLDAFINNFDNACRELMDKVALAGEDYIKNNDDWEQLLDTGSLRASVTGFEVKVGDPDHNYGDQEWARARAEGNIHGRRAQQNPLGYHYNPPINYEKQEFGSVDESVPTAVVTAWVDYSLDNPKWEGLVHSLFDDGLNWIARYATSEIAIYAFKDLWG